MIKTRLLLTALLMSIAYVFSYAQAIQLFDENFESGGGTFTLNSGGPVANYGTNSWIVNNNYVGLPFYPNTISENVTYSGSISFPDGQYLHIHDVNTNAVSNSNYNPTNQSDNFAYMTTGVCTMGMNPINLTFFYNCEGSTTAYAEVYYSLNGGPWVQTGQAQYANRSEWQYETITDPAFSNVQSLQIGFRWVNASTTDTPTVSMGIDDIIIEGTFDTVDYPLQMNITSVMPDTVCVGGQVFFTYQLADTLCDGTYLLQISDGTGNFGNLTNLFIFDIFYPQTTGSFGFLLPTNFGPDSCYRLRVNRLTPPAFTGNPGPCITIISCPNTITTLQPVVTMDTNAVCVGSVIDVPFYSTGQYTAGNVYTAVLSDSAGNFCSTCDTAVIGTSPDTKTYDPSLGSLPGTVSGILPDEVDGCNYYIHIISNHPPCVGSVWGPFCIQHCDINTNEDQSVHICLTPNDSPYISPDTVLDVDVHKYFNNQVYNPGNIFKIQLLDMMAFQPVGALGALGQQAATSDTIVRIVIPNLTTLLAMGISPGAYYLRVVATNTLYQDSSLGNLIHLTIGAPSDIPPSTLLFDYSTFTQLSSDTICNTQTIYFEPNPFNFNSQYVWTSGQLQNSPLNQQTLAVLFTGFTGRFIWTLQEINYGCPGPVSAPDTLFVLGPPNPTISGPHYICLGDTAHFSVPFAQNTYYEWTSPNGGAVIDTANDTLSIRFDTVGSYTLHILCVNQCGSASSTKQVIVVVRPTAEAGSDTSICPTDSIKLTQTPTNVTYGYKWYGNSINNTVLGTSNTVWVHPQVPTDYIVKVIQIQTQGACFTLDTIHIGILPYSLVTHKDTICVGDTLTLSPTNTGTGYNWNTGASSQNITVYTGGTYSAIIPQSAGCPSIDSFYVDGIARLHQTQTDSICYPDTLNLDAGSSGASYIWSSGQTSQQITVTKGGLYIAHITPPGARCDNLDTFNIIHAPQFVGSNIDSLCNGASVLLDPGNTSGATYSWNNGATSQTITVNTTGIFVVTINIPNARCASLDTFNVTDSLCPVLTLPNVFSPNGDGVNDFFTPMIVGVYDIFHVDIFNRWGEKIWESNDEAFKWPGTTMHGDIVPDGTYYYIATASRTGKNFHWTGYVTKIK